MKKFLIIITFCQILFLIFIVRRNKEDVILEKPKYCPVDIDELINSKERLAFGGNGINMLVANNVCIGRGTGLKTKIIIHTDKRVMPIKWRDMRNSKNHWKYYGFGWSYVFEEKPMTNDIKYEDYEPGTWVTAAAFPRHINHFAENLQVFSHIALNKECYGDVRKIVFPSYDESSELDHSKKILKTLLTMYEEEPEVSSEIKCYKKVKILGRIVISHGGGIFYNLIEAEKYRQHALKYLSIRSSNYFGVTYNDYGVPSHIRIFFSERSTREIENKAEIYSHIRKYLGHVVVIDGFEMVTKSVEEQLSVMTDTDIMIGAHGTNLHNSLFMSPGGVVIEMTQYHMITEHFSNLAAATGKMHYLFQCEKPENWEKAVRNCVNMTVYEGTSKCRDTMFMPLKVDVGWLEVIIRKSIWNVIQLKYPQIGGHLRP